MSDGMIIVIVSSIVLLFLAFFLTADVARRNKRESVGFINILLSAAFLLAFGLVYGYQIGYQTRGEEDAKNNISNFKQRFVYIPNPGIDPVNNPGGAY